LPEKRLPITPLPAPLAMAASLPVSMPRYLRLPDRLASSRPTSVQPPPAVVISQ